MKLTGAYYFRELKRFMREPVQILVVEVRGRRASVISHLSDSGNSPICNQWVDANAQQVSELYSIYPQVKVVNNEH